MDIGQKLKMNVSVYTTKEKGDGFRFVREVCSTFRGEELRFFACGGDGTMNEVINALDGTEKVSFGVVPLGTGNDFVRNFGDSDLFLDLKAQLMGNICPIDLIWYSSRLGQEYREGYAGNMINIGFDANVVARTNEFKKNPFLPGTAAYLLGVFSTLIRKEGANLRVEIDGQEVHRGKLLLCTAANGCFCGGGIKGLPLAVLDDGLMDISIIKDVSRWTFLRLFPKYAKGRHLETKTAETVVKYYQRFNTAVKTQAEPLQICIDGELAYSEELTLTLMPRAAQFVKPCIFV